MSSKTDNVPTYWTKGLDRMLCDGVRAVSTEIANTHSSPQVDMSDPFQLEENGKSRHVEVNWKRVSTSYLKGVRTAESCRARWKKVRTIRTCLLIFCFSSFFISITDIYRDKQHQENFANVLGKAKRQRQCFKSFYLGKNIYCILNCPFYILISVWFILILAGTGADAYMTLSAPQVIYFSTLQLVCPTALSMIAGERAQEQAHRMQATIEQNLDE